MANYHVVKNKGLDKWAARREGAKRVAGYFKTQAKAEKMAKQMSSNSGGGEVRIHTPQGVIRDSDTVAPAKDPYPPKDTKH